MILHIKHITLPLSFSLPSIIFHFFLPLLFLSFSPSLSSTPSFSLSQSKLSWKYPLPCTSVSGGSWYLQTPSMPYKRLSLALSCQSDHLQLHQEQDKQQVNQQPKRIKHTSKSFAMLYMWYIIYIVYIHLREHCVASSHMSSDFEVLHSLTSSVIPLELPWVQQVQENQLSSETNTWSQIIYLCLAKTFKPWKYGAVMIHGSRLQPLNLLWLPVIYSIQEKEKNLPNRHVLIIYIMRTQNLIAIAIHAQHGWSGSNEKCLI